jgi:hypothetical protein
MAMLNNQRVKRDFLIKWEFLFGISPPKKERNHVYIMGLSIINLDQ